MAVELFYLDPVPSASEGITTPSATSGGVSAVAKATTTSATGQDNNLANKVESLAQYINDLRDNAVRTNSDASLNSLNIKNRLEANFGRIGGWDINAGVLSTSKLQLDSNN